MDLCPWWINLVNMFEACEPDSVDQTNPSVPYLAACCLAWQIATTSSFDAWQRGRGVENLGAEIIFTSRFSRSGAHKGQPTWDSDQECL